MATRNAANLKVLNRVSAEAAVTPPEVNLSAKKVIASSKTPIRQLINKLPGKNDRIAVETISNEVQETSKAIESLPESEQLVRQFHAAEVLNVPLTKLDAAKPRPAGSRYGQMASAKVQLTAAVALAAHVPRAASVVRDWPDREEVTAWINAARQPTTSKVASCNVSNELKGGRGWRVPPETTVLPLLRSAQSSPGHPILQGTTDRALVRFWLKRLAERADFAGMSAAAAAAPCRQCSDECISCRMKRSLWKSV